MKESPLAREGFWDTLGVGRGGLLSRAGPGPPDPCESFLGLAGDFPVPLPPPLSLGKVEANLLPVFLSLTSKGLKPKSPPPPLLGAGWGLGLGG